MTTIELRPHQKEAVESCKVHPYGTITDTCGAGKSYEEAELIYDAFDNGANVVCYGAHRLALILQQKHSLLKYGEARVGTKYRYTATEKDFTILEVSSADREHDATTVITEIVAAIEHAKRNNEKLLIYFCYASAERLYKALEKFEKKADMILMDEAHYGNMSTNDSDEQFNRHLFRNVAERMYFFTATPTTLTTHHMGLEVMPVIHSYNYGDALQDGVVLPFTVHWLIKKPKETEI